MNQCDRCGGWFGLAWTCSACQQLGVFLTRWTAR